VPAATGSAPPEAEAGPPFSPFASADGRWGAILLSAADAGPPFSPFVSVPGAYRACPRPRRRPVHRYRRLHRWAVRERRPPARRVRVLPSTSVAPFSPFATARGRWPFGAFARWFDPGRAPPGRERAGPGNHRSPHVNESLPGPRTLLPAPFPFSGRLFRPWPYGSGSRRSRRSMRRALNSPRETRGEARAMRPLPGRPPAGGGRGTCRRRPSRGTPFPSHRLPSGTRQRGPASFGEQAPASDAAARSRARTRTLRAPFSRLLLDGSPGVYNDEVERGGSQRIVPQAGRSIDPQDLSENAERRPHSAQRFAFRLRLERRMLAPQIRQRARAGVCPCSRSFQFRIRLRCRSPYGGEGTGASCCLSGQVLLLVDGRMTREGCLPPVPGKAMSGQAQVYRPLAGGR
jgi:hypothetical protein